MGSAPNAALFFCTYDTIKKQAIRKWEFLSFPLHLRHNQEASNEKLRVFIFSSTPTTQSRSKQLESESLQKELPLGLRLQFSDMALLIQPDFICLPPALERYNVFYFLNICIERRGTNSYSQHHRHFNHLDTQVSSRVVHFHRVSSEVVHSQLNFTSLRICKLQFPGLSVSDPSSHRDR